MALVEAEVTHNLKKTLRSYTDSGWKEALRIYFKQFIELCWPEAYEDIDWGKGYEILEQELQAVNQIGSKNPRITDKLIKVWRKCGIETVILVHLEVQKEHSINFAERMFCYRYRIYDKYKKPIAAWLFCWTTAHIGVLIFIRKVSGVLRFKWYILF